MPHREARAPSLPSARPASAGRCAELPEFAHARTEPPAVTATRRCPLERYRSLYDHTPSMGFIVDPSGSVLSVNQFGAEKLGCAPQDLIDRPIWQVFCEADRSAAQAQLAECLASPGRVFQRGPWQIATDARVRWVRVTARAVPDRPGGAIVLLVCEDITEQRRAEERLRYLAQQDRLTGLPNGPSIRDRLAEAIAEARRRHHRVAVVFIDLDHFKDINDSLGHQTGDDVLQTAAQRLRHCLREGDTVARPGGDEFVVCMPALTDASEAIGMAAKALAALRRPFTVNRHELHLSASIGISLFPADGQDAEALMRAADTAMYHAKETGRDTYRFSTPRLEEAARHRLTIVNRLHHALKREEFFLQYQPQIDLASGRIFAAEALVRWHQPGRAPMLPGEFIQIAEDNGLIAPIGEWVLGEACRQLERWHRAGYPDLRMSINFSPRQFHGADFPELTARRLRASGLSPASLVMEITENVLMLQNPENTSTLNQLAAMGVHLAVDDFGTGYSSLAYLQRFPVRTLKIDRSFVGGIGHDPNDAAIVKTIIAMADSLHLQVIAEGVETPDQVVFLKHHGCRAAQGFLFGAAVSAGEFGDLLRAQHTRTSDATRLLAS